MFVKLDLTDQGAIRRAAKSAMATPYEKPKQGIKLQIRAIEKVEPHRKFLQDQAPLQSLPACPNGCFKNLGSMAYVMGDVNFGNYYPRRAGGSSKSAAIFFNICLPELWGGKGVPTFNVQPGMPQTSLYTHTQDPDSKSSFAEAYNVI
ncbi:hypothetical protein B0J14DRAFT_167419 [Halenospora varia]|nr:hypothetical protein B0J14DRAFT_167419 [Halenospora varia]